MEICFSAFEQSRRCCYCPFSYCMFEQSRRCCYCPFSYCMFEQSCRCCYCPFSYCMFEQSRRCCYCMPILILYAMHTKIYKQHHPSPCICTPTPTHTLVWVGHHSRRHSRRDHLSWIKGLGRMEGSPSRWRGN